LSYSQDMKPLRFAVIGLGGMGAKHAQNLSHHHAYGIILVSACDNDPAVVEKQKFELPRIPLYLDYHEMIAKEEIDAVLIATPHYSHVQIAMDCLEKGLNVLVEKPLAVTAMEAEKLVALAKKYPHQLCGVAFNQRSNPVYSKAKEYLPALKTIRSARFDISNWYRSDSYYRLNSWRGSYALEGGGCLINQCHHQLDLIVYLLGLPDAVEAHCATVDRNIDVENDVVALFYYPTFILTFTASCHDLKGVNDFEISGDGGRLKMDKMMLDVYLHQDELKVNKTIKAYEGVPIEEHHLSYPPRQQQEDRLYGQQVQSLRYFASALHKRDKQLATLEDGLKDVQLLNAIYLSSWTKSKVKVPVDEKVYAEALAAKITEEKAKN